MFKSLALISVLTSTALAQSTASTSANPLIPSGITAGCTNFLNSLNSNSNLTSCLSALTNTTSAFTPGGAAPSSSAVTSTLTNLCNGTVASTCPDSLIREQITAFYAACPAELTTNSNPNVVKIYDVLYSFLPFLTTVCSKDSSGHYCVQGPSASARELDENADESSPFSSILDLLYIKGNAALKRRDQLAALVPNTTTYQQTNLAFGFFTPDFNASQLCVPCLHEILTAYIQFESNTPYAPQLQNSQILSTQPALLSAVQSKCPADFLSGAVQAAGGLSGSSSAIPTYGAEYQRILALVMGVATLVVSVSL